MKYERTESFKGDFQRLTDDEQSLFRSAIRRINDAYSNRGDRTIPRWPSELRVKRVQGAKGIWELTWSFSGPDGRATFEVVTIDGEPGILGRRVGDHRIFAQP